MSNTAQMNLGNILVKRARACMDLSCGVPAEYEQGLIDQADAHLAAAAALGDADAIAWITVVPQDEFVADEVEGRCWG